MTRLRPAPFVVTYTNEDGKLVNLPDDVTGIDTTLLPTDRDMKDQFEEWKISEDKKRKMRNLMCGRPEPKDVVTHNLLSLAPMLTPIDLPAVAKSAVNMTKFSPNVLGFVDITEIAPRVFELPKLAGLPIDADTRARHAEMWRISVEARAAWTPPADLQPAPLVLIVMAVPEKKRHRRMIASNYKAQFKAWSTTEKALGLDPLVAPIGLKTAADLTLNTSSGMSSMLDITDLMPKAWVMPEIVGQLSDAETVARHKQAWELDGEEAKEDMEADRQPPSTVSADPRRP